MIHPTFEEPEQSRFKARESIIGPLIGLIAGIILLYAMHIVGLV
jgi:hypothetical protein